MKTNLMKLSSLNTEKPLTGYFENNTDHQHYKFIFSKHTLYGNIFSDKSNLYFKLNRIIEKRSTNLR